ncbi:MAG: putative baseplate assembly protein [Gammaproteobacteria bacterium]|nr:putative baseplate assembly protein [Gammaproteobacteria bacterium]
MVTRYFCKVPGRRQAVLAPNGFNGIDYLEVATRVVGGVDDTSDLIVGDDVPQARLVLTFLKEVSVDQFNKDNVRIEGGERVRDIKIIAVNWPLGTASTQVEIDVENAGDFSVYTLRIVQGLGRPQPPAWLDSILCEVDFSFKAECPSDFDCIPVSTCITEPKVEPDIDYLAKDYASFRQLMFDRLSTVMPQWRERNPADLGVAAIETLAYAADQLSYYQDAVATEAYLGTARRRVSVRRHARLLDYAMHDGCNARVWVHIAIDPEVASYVLRAHTPILTGSEWPDGLQIQTVRAPGVGVLAPWSRIALRGVPADRQVFETLHDVVLQHGLNQIDFYTWGDEDCCLAQGATYGCLRNQDRKLDGLAAGDLLLFEEVRDAVGNPSDADRRHRHVVRLTSVTFDTDTLYNVNVVNIRWSAEDALPFPLCLSRRAATPGEAAQAVSVARGNIVLADHGATHADEPLEPAVVTDARRYRPYLKRVGLAHAQPYDVDAARSKSAAAALRQDPRQTLPTVSLRQSMEVWTARRDLLGSDRFAEEFVVETESDRRAYLRFGDGILGRRPIVGTTFLATYRLGGGAAGNVGANTLKLVVIPAGETIASVQVSATNPLPAQGGVEPEEIEHVRFYAPQAFRSQRRAVVPADYATLAEDHPQVQKAVAAQRWTGSWHTIFVTVDRRAGLPVDAQFETELLEYLEPFRLMGHDLEIEAPRMVALDIALRVCVAAGYLKSAVKKALLEVFSSGRRSDNSLGFFHPDQLTFGESVYLSTVIAAAMRIAGVTWVAAERFKRWGEADSGQLAQGFINIGRIEIARLDNDPNAPNHGRLELIMEGGL